MDSSDYSTGPAPGLLRRRPEIVLIPLLFVLIIGSWHGVVKGLAIPDYVIPAPGQVATAFWSGVTSGSYLAHAAYTLSEALLGFFIAAFLGTLFGTLIAQSRIIERTLYPYLIVIQTTPKIAIAPLLIIWFGFGITSKIFIAATVAFFPILVNVIAGLRSIDAEKIELMRSLKATKWQTFRMARLPSALPTIFAGLKVAIVFSILGAIVGEFVGSKVGLGNLILQANVNLDTAGIFGVLVCLAIMGITLHLVMEWLQRRLVFWTASARSGDY
ncbi:ABC transporter permease [Enterovirga aerilata]|uniref:ABC transporter permease n=1 Tax=Enterovirga aerilata TaxID=2730920 RepID=A0A849I5I3_9HYPH|nr:ABC transporter permease [Enterovirga sp. DB1703]NNM71595.1 ABC transporter permease [Enterovirga sp. DB1703]